MNRKRERRRSIWDNGQVGQADIEKYITSEFHENEPVRLSLNFSKQFEINYNENLSGSFSQNSLVTTDS